MVGASVDNDLINLSKVFFHDLSVFEWFCILLDEENSILSLFVCIFAVVSLGKTDTRGVAVNLLLALELQ